jgi:AcrR family transcriptional regulator
LNSGPLDGRRLRSQQSRQRIIDAMIDLVRAGNPSPTAEEVAVRASIAMRTVFRHFDDMENLYREIAQRIESEAQAMLSAHVEGVTWRERLDNMIDNRVALYRILEPMKRAADTMRHRSAFLQADHEKFVRLGRQRLIEQLPEQLCRDASCVEALDGLTSFEFYSRLTRDQKLTPKRAGDVIKATVSAFLDAADLRLAP